MAERFALESVLDYKQKMEDLREQEMAQAQIRVREAEHYLAVLTEKLQGQYVALRRLQIAAPLDVSALQWTEIYLVRLESEIDSQRALLHGFRAELQASRERLLEATKERKAIEKLKERWLAEVEARNRRAEQIATDETATVRFNRARQAQRLSGGQA